MSNIYILNKPAHVNVPQELLNKLPTELWLYIIKFNQDDFEKKKEILSQNFIRKETFSWKEKSGNFHSIMETRSGNCIWIDSENGVIKRYADQTCFSDIVQPNWKSRLDYDFYVSFYSEHESSVKGPVIMGFIFNLFMIDINQYTRKDEDKIISDFTRSYYNYQNR